MKQWDAVDRYLEERLTPLDDALQAALRSSQEASLPPIQVTATQGKLLHLLARSIHASRILEVGTLGGYSAIWLARALPPGGRLVTLEVDPRHAEVARANLARAGLEGVVELRLGPAAGSLAALEAVGGPPFDLTFIDADKPSTTSYFLSALRLSRPGSLIVVDNVIREGEIVDPDSRDEATEAMRTLLDTLSHEPRVTATAIQTVGGKGYDGFAIALVN